MKKTGKIMFVGIVMFGCIVFASFGSAAESDNNISIQKNARKLIIIGSQGFPIDNDQPEFVRVHTTNYSFPPVLYRYSKGGK